MTTHRKRLSDTIRRLSRFPSLLLNQGILQSRCPILVRHRYSPKHRRNRSCRNRPLNHLSCRSRRGLLHPIQNHRFHRRTLVALSHRGPLRYPPTLGSFHWQEYPRSGFARTFDLYPLLKLNNYYVQEGIRLMNRKRLEKDTVFFWEAGSLQKKNWEKGIICDQRVIAIDRYLKGADIARKCFETTGRDNDRPVESPSRQANEKICCHSSTGSTSAFEFMVYAFFVKKTLWRNRRQ